MKVVRPKANPGKQISIDVGGKSYDRYPIKTEVFKNGDEYAIKIANHIEKFSSCLSTLLEKRWYVIVSEKIVAISQGRSYFIKDIKPSWVATTLSKYVRKTPHGIGLGSPWTMQLAIGEVGVPRILFASVLSILTKPFGLRGVFYHVAGRSAAAIDGPTSYSLYPSNVSAKLAPKDPQKAAERIKVQISKSKVQSSNFGGVVIIDANDLGRNVLGNASDKSDTFFEEVMRDNPMGQGIEGTPVVLLY
ncbi:hypothetical protein COY16_00620 [Candidatus Roizmanbacteria bacterium CG_4_10_14_0_2_um_filter_39_13]|uniref:Coenzyme F420:L-glutamate ligase-like domain-containing protein n=1 Tax=Candidatus Roizmanbacteria bacterium CG_4_10_14_0_2_um_filter_39_13 TaxID=1974825 RepID=A0A2M7U1K6_9BACT|nr:MAG: hypothetical protein COY16_00620 [Candidatus Roizmanbacteria bacterium CG_4_10_14_0_2_um_filter_39_13]